MKYTSVSSRKSVQTLLSYSGNKQNEHHPLTARFAAITFTLWLFSHSATSNSFMTPWAVAHRAPLSMGFPKQEILQWVAISFSRGPSQPRDQTRVSWIAGRFFAIWATRKPIIFISTKIKVGWPFWKSDDSISEYKLNKINIFSIF